LFPLAPSLPATQKLIEEKNCDVSLIFRHITPLESVKAIRKQAKNARNWCELRPTTRLESVKKLREMTMQKFASNRNNPWTLLQ
jgi:hypothetical protein